MVDVMCCVDSRVAFEVVTSVELAAQDDSLPLLLFPLRSPALSRDLNWVMLEGGLLAQLLSLSSRVKCTRMKER